MIHFPILLMLHLEYFQLFETYSQLFPALLGTCVRVARDRVPLRENDNENP